MEVGQVWEGRSKVGGPFTRRRIVAITEARVEWEIAGSCFNGPRAGSIGLASWLTWAKLQVMR
tara:strand:+ start:483 stop:671 length:189 start_codon:yes stop_codon:yes gene_type:complete